MTHALHFQVYIQTKYTQMYNKSHFQECSQRFVIAKNWKQLKFPSIGE